MLLYYPDGTSVMIPDIDSAIWIQLHGLSPTPPEQQPAAPAPVSLQSVALEVINQAEAADDIAVLPSIGKASARVILEVRPDGGYQSLEQVWEKCDHLLGRPYNVNPEAVAAYGDAA